MVSLWWRMSTFCTGRRQVTVYTLERYKQLSNAKLIPYSFAVQTLQGKELLSFCVERTGERGRGDVCEFGHFLRTQQSCCIQG